MESEDPQRSQSASEQLRHLVHDIRNSLASVSLGMEILKEVRLDADQFDAVIQSMRRDGLEPLKEATGTLANLAAELEDGTVS